MKAGRIDYDHYKEWAKENKHTIQISYPRSGRYWLIGLIEAITEVDHKFLLYGREQGYSKYMSSHPYRSSVWEPTSQYVLVVRDPRDAFISHCYYAIELGCEYDPFEDMELWERYIENWRKGIRLFSQWKTLIVQYERLCLYPVKVIRKILSFADLPEVNNIRDAVLNEDTPERYDNSWDRYREHCKKWQTEERFTPIHNALVWSGLSDIMIHYGYGRNRHNHILLQ